MRRRQALREAQEHIAETIVALLRRDLVTHPVGLTVQSIDQCIDEPRAVQIQCRVWHDDCPGGEPIQFEITMREVIGTAV